MERRTDRTAEQVIAKDGGEPFVDFIHRWDDRRQVRRGTREVKRHILQDLVKASLSLLLFMLVSRLTSLPLQQFELMKTIFTVCSDGVNYLPVFQGEVQHIKSQVPAGLDIAQHDPLKHLRVVDALLPCWQEKSGRVDDLEGELPKLGVVP